MAGPAHEAFMREAIRFAEDGSRSGRGGPFGCVVVRKGNVVGRGCNEVTSTNDPTAHAEMVAIRAAAKALGTFKLDDCTLYASCEPCPMCLAAIHWARIPEVFFANTRADAAEIGFDDAKIARELDGRQTADGGRRSSEVGHQMPEVRMIPLLRDEAQPAFRAWRRKPGVAY